jgi:hypothetical protein
MTFSDEVLKLLQISHPNHAILLLAQKIEDLEAQLEKFKEDDDSMTIEELEEAVKQASGINPIMEGPMPDEENVLFESITDYRPGQIKIYTNRPPIFKYLSGSQQAASPLATDSDSQ